LKKIINKCKRKKNERKIEENYIVFRKIDEEEKKRSVNRAILFFVVLP